MPRPLVPQRSSQAGFALVEVLVATVVLLVGMLGILSLLTGSLRTTSMNNARVSGTNLARELVERTRGLAYDDMQGGLVQTRMQAAGLGSGSPWTIERRGVVYNASALSCTYDDPTDGFAATPPVGVCTPQPPPTPGAPTDANGEDFRRTTFRLTWLPGGAGPEQSVTQATLVVNPSGGLGPRVTDIAPVTQTITGPGVSTVPVTWTTTLASALQWSVDDGVSTGSVTGTTSFTAQWPIGISNTVGGAPNVGERLDGPYEMTAQPYDDRNIAGEAMRANIVLNRRRPYAPPSLEGGHNTRPGWAGVELEWGRNKERDILGYRTTWAGGDGVVGTGDDQPACLNADGGTLLKATTTSCLYITPSSGAATYYVVAVDRDANNDLRAGDPRTLQIPAAGGRPNPPTALVATSLTSNRVLVWVMPITIPLLGGVPQSFYRIYRDGVRYDTAPGNAITYTDTGAGDATHQYSVTAVSSTFNESDPSNLVVSLP